MKYKKLIITLFVIVAVIVGVGYFGKRIIVQKAAEKVSEKFIENIDTSNMTDEEAAKMKDLYNNMDQKDKKVIEDIISDHVDMKTIQKATDYVKDGNTQELKKMADEQLSEEEKAKMKEIYKKYITENK